MGSAALSSFLQQSLQQYLSNILGLFIFTGMKDQAEILLDACLTQHFVTFSFTHGYDYFIELVTVSICIWAFALRHNPN